MTGLMKTKKMQFQIVEILEENFPHNSFVDISTMVDNYNSENTIEEDPLSLDPKLEVDINRNCKVLKSFNVSKTCDFDAGEIDCIKSNLSSNAIDKKIFICYVCKKKKPKMCFLDFIQIDHPYSKLNSFLEKEEMDPSDNKYQCKFCTDVYITPKIYLIHLKTKHDEELRQCNFCFQSWPVKDYLKPHKKFYQTFFCQTCNKTMRKESSYLSHISNHYQRQCTICLKVFAKYGSLMSHMKLCNLQNNKCHGCDESFPTLLSLDNHKLVCKNIQSFNNHY